MAEKCYFEISEERWESRMIPNPQKKGLFGWWLFEPKTIDDGKWVETGESDCALTSRGYRFTSDCAKKCDKGRCPIWQILLKLANDA